jgi:tetratricopeptide (TPR) repeat protein
MITKHENDLTTAGFLKKGGIKKEAEKSASELEDAFMRATRDFADHFRKEQKDVIAIAPKLQEFRPAETKAITAIGFPGVGAGDFKDFEKLLEFAKTFSKVYLVIHEDVNRQVKSRLDENKAIVDTYERHITIDKGEVSTTVANEDVADLSMKDLIILNDKLLEDKKYLDGRKDEVSRLLSTSLVSDTGSLQASVDTASRLGLELPMEFSQQLRLLQRDASKAQTLTDLVSLENQLHTSKVKLANMLRDKIINIKHDITQKIVDGGIPTTADVIPTPPTVSVEGEGVAGLLSSYQRMVEWEGQVKIALREQVIELLDDVDKATVAPEDTGIKDVASVKQFIADSKKGLKDADVDEMVRVYLKASGMNEDYKRNITENIRSYLTRFNELATSADRVLDYAQLSKKAPKVEELEGGITYLLESLTTLRSAVESGVATFREACQQEIDAIIHDLQTIKPAYAEIFMPIIVDLDEGSMKIKKLNDFSEIKSEMRTIKETMLAKANDSLENLRYRLGVKIRLAAAKLMGAGVQIPPDVQEAISELNSIGVAADNVFGLPATARKMIEIYEKKISSKVISQLDQEIDELKTSLEKAQSIGVKVDKELKMLEKMKSKPATELEEAADYFDKLMNLTTSPKVHKKIRDRVDEAYEQIKSAVTLFEDQGMSEFVERLKTLIDQVPAKLENHSPHVNEALDVCLTLANIQEEMLTVIKNIANMSGEKYAEELKEKSQYISTIERVVEKYPDEFSKLVFNTNKMKELENTLMESNGLDEAISCFHELEEVRKKWLDQAIAMDDWHKSLRMFMAGFSPSAKPDERDKFIDDAIRKIRETYSREDISSYLSWAIKESAQALVERKK